MDSRAGLPFHLTSDVVVFFWRGMKAVAYEEKSQDKKGTVALSH
jgi:hypothetical protein